MTYAASSDARNPTAGQASDGAEKRPIGIAALSSSRRSSGIYATMSVSAFGEMALTVTPNRASSLAVVRVNPMIPALAAA